MSLVLFRKPEMSDSATVLEAFKFIESAAAEFSDEDEDEDSDGREKSIIDLATVRLHRVLYGERNNYHLITVCTPTDPTLSLSLYLADDEEEGLPVSFLVLLLLLLG